jgi:protein transport protein SEC24
LHYSGERRIRVITHALPVVSTLAEVYASADQVAIASLLAKKGEWYAQPTILLSACWCIHRRIAVERSLSSKLEDAREAVSAKCIEIAGIYKTELTAAGSGASVHLQLSENLKLLPLLTLGLLKHVSTAQDARRVVLI